jgi:two-component system phosphate regulon sensor histidine kinase PhoR
LNTIVGEVIDMYSFHLENNGFTYTTNLSEIKMPIMADKDAIIESLINLIENAIKYSPETKIIDLSTGKDGEYGFVEVTDHGIGISADKQSKIFDKFYRITEGDIYKVQGAGLGLSIVKHIMESHEGRVDIKSTVGKGSAFRLYFKIENQ